MPESEANALALIMAAAISFLAQSIAPDPIIILRTRNKSERFGSFFSRILFIVSLIALLRTVVARLRIDQMIDFCWKFLVPLALLQLLFNLMLKGILLKWGRQRC